ncbi:hypothetical protein [Streptomyces sp. NRRL F-2799]|nr:hypothetical protein [Streptomyces sp. NRRL F-2799]
MDGPRDTAAFLVASWDGQVVLFPYLDGRSTSGIAERAAHAPGGTEGARR